MKKISTLFVRDEATQRRYVKNEVTPGCEWVLAGEGVPTRKYDGTCVMLDENGGWWARREVKPGKEQPPNFAPISHDDLTGKTVGWEPAEQSGFAKFINEALTNATGTLAPGTYELCGPKINGNPERIEEHRLIAHGVAIFDPDAPRTFEGLREYLQDLVYEGIVWHHPDDRMAKLKKRDFPRDVETTQ